MATRKGATALAGPRQAQVDAFFAMHDARDEIERTVTGAIEAALDGSDEHTPANKSDVADAVSELITDHDATRDSLIELSEKGAGKALAQAFNLDKGQNAREVLRSDFAQALRHALQHDDIVRAALADVIGAEIANGIKAALRDALPGLREAVRNGIELHEAEKAQGAPDREV